MRVLVVGAGPAGAMTAQRLACRGIDVTVVDRAQFPRDKACGDVVGPRALKTLEEVDIALGSDYRHIGSMLLGFEGAEMLLPSRPGLGHSGFGLAIRRREFDQLLLGAAMKAGAKNRVATVGSIERVGSTFRVQLGDEVESFDVVVGADGANSSVARTFAMVEARRALMGFALRRHAQGKVAADRVDLLIDERGIPGYGWAFDQGRGEINFGVGVGVGTVRANARGLREMLDRYQEQLVSQQRLELVGLHQELGGWLKMGLRGTQVATDGVYLVGDAAGMVNPLQGEGIAAALASGVVSAEIIERHGPDGALAYRRRITEEFGDFLSVGYFAQSYALRHPRAAHVAMSTLVRVGRSRAVASAWGLFWNDLTTRSGPQSGSSTARLALRAGSVLAGLAGVGTEWQG